MIIYQRFTNRCCIASDIKPQRGWDKKISPKLYGFSKKLLEENNYKQKSKLFNSVKNQLSPKLKENEKKSKEKKLKTVKTILLNMKMLQSFPSNKYFI